MSSDFQEQLKRLNAAGAFNPAAARAETVQSEPVAKERPEPTLPSLWKHAHELMVERSGDFISLKIIAEARPISLTQGDGWLAWVKKANDGVWEVGVWKNQLAGITQRYANEEIGQAASSILASSKGLKVDCWVRVGEIIPSPPPPVAKPRGPHRLREFG